MANFKVIINQALGKSSYHRLRLACAQLALGSSIVLAFGWVGVAHANKTKVVDNLEKKALAGDKKAAAALRELSKGEKLAKPGETLRAESHQATEALKQIPTASDNQAASDNQGQPKKKPRGLVKLLKGIAAAPGDRREVRRYRKEVAKSAIGRANPNISEPMNVEHKRVPPRIHITAPTPVAPPGTLVKKIPKNEEGQAARPQGPRQGRSAPGTANKGSAARPRI